MKAYQNKENALKLLVLKDQLLINKKNIEMEKDIGGE